MTRRFVRAGVFAFVLSTLVPAAGFAQVAQSSSIAGAVRDASGAVMPGVTVEAASPVLIERVRTATTDGQGLYKLTDLRPGLYSVTFTLTGFSTVRREGIDLPAAFTATVNADLRVGGVEETITVTGQAPLVDVQNVVTQKVISNELVEALPTTRTSALVGLAPTVPGMTGGLGLLSVASTQMSIHGSTGSEANLTIDGFPVRVIFTMQTYYWPNQSTVQEVVVQTEGQSAETQLGSVWMNSIPKEGANRFSGSFFGLYTDHNLQADNLTDTLKARGLTSVDTINKQWEISPSGGGPIVADRLWFFGAYQQNPTIQNVANNYYNKDPRGFTYIPDLSKPAYVRIRNYSKEVRLTWQASPRNKVSVAYDHTPHYTDERDFSALVSPEATAYAPYLPMYFATGTWRSTVSNRLLLEAGYGTQISNIDNRRQFIDLDQQVGYDISSVRDSNKNYLYRARTTYGDRPSYVYMSRASASYITGSHAFKGGMNLVTGRDVTRTDVNNSMNLTFTNGKPSSMTLNATPNEVDTRVNADLGLFVQDQWTLKKMTLSYGLRFDYLNASADATDLAAGRFVAARHFDKVDNVPNWKDITPRLGVAYDLFGNGRTALKVSVGKYVNFEGTTIANANHGVNASINSATRTWTDSNGNFNPDCNFSNPNAQDNSATGGDVCGRLSNLSFGSNNPLATTWDHAVTEGWGVRPYNWSSAVQVQHQLQDGISISAGYYRRWFGNFRVTDNTLVSPEDYSTYCITAPVDAALPADVSGARICGLYDVSVVKSGQVQNYNTSASNFGKQTQIYNGIDVTTSIRVKGITVNGGVSTGRTATNTCFVVDSPQALQFCDVTPPFQPNTKFSGLYTLPWWDLQTSFVWQNLPGSQITASYTALNAEILPTLLRNLAAGANGTAVIPIIKPGTLYGPRINTLDFRVLKSVKVGNYRVQGTAQIFNLLNSSDVLVRNLTYGTAASHASWGQPTSVLQGRYVQFTGQISF